MNISESRALLPRRASDHGVSTLELFFDLVFVLAITQCTSLMAHHPTPIGIGQGVVVLALLWWAWVGYAWLTSVVNAEHVAVRLPIFVAMGALAITAMVVPKVFDGYGMLFAATYAAVRVGQILLFMAGAGDDPVLKKSIVGLGVGTAIGTSILLYGATLEPKQQLLVWIIAAALDIISPYLYGSDGWTLAPAHFAERHGLITIIALGEGIIAVGVSASSAINAESIVAVVLATTIFCCLWWTYFDVASLAAERSLRDEPVGKDQNEMARDAYSYIHFLMIGGLTLLALGLKKSISHLHDPLGGVETFALLGGVSLFLLGLNFFVRRTRRSWTTNNLVGAIAVALLTPMALYLSAIVTLCALTAIVLALVVYKAVRFSVHRLEIRAPTLSR